MAFVIEKELHRVPKSPNSSAFYKYQLAKVNGKPVVDVREHFTRKDGTEQYTAKGFSIPLESFADVMVGFRDVHEKLREQLT